MGKDTYVAETARELKPDVTEIVRNSSPDDTPLYSLFSKGKNMSNMTSEWLEDDLPTATDNAYPEGFEFSFADPDVRLRFQNYAQKFAVSYGVTGDQEEASKYGVNSELDYQMIKASKKLALDIERRSLFGDKKVYNATILTGLTNDTGLKKGRLMGGLPYFFDTTNATGFYKEQVLGLNNIDPSRAVNFAPVVMGNGGVARPFEEELLCELIRQIWEKSKGTSNLIAIGSSKNATIASRFTGGAIKNIDASEKKIVSTIKVIETDFGLIKFIPHRQMAVTNNRIYCIDKDKWRYRYYRPIIKEKRVRDSDMVGELLHTTLTLEAGTMQTQGIITDLDT